MSKLGFAIITSNREAAFNSCYNSIVKYASKDSVIAVVENSSMLNYAYKAPYYFLYPDRVTISVAKNKAMQMLYDKDCDYFFIIEDDVIALCENWFLPYVESPAPHLCYTFLPSSGEFKGIKHHALGNGCMLYFTKECIDRIGGFDTNYPNKYDHIDLSRRIYNAGITLHQFGDVVGSEKLLYCLDQDKAIERSFTEEQMAENLQKGFEHFNATRNNSNYIEFRT